MSVVVIEINGRRRNLLPCPDGTFGRRIAIRPSGAYVFADVGVVHGSRCSSKTATATPRRGACNCGAESLFRKVLAQ